MSGTQDIFSTAAAQSNGWDDLQTKLADKGWRLLHLYTIRNKDAVEVPFIPNDVQMELAEGLHSRTVVLKSRQHGVTTFMAIYELDDCLFVPNTQCAIIAHTQDDAKGILDTKVRYVLQKALADWPEIFGGLRIVRDSAGEIVLSNGSRIYVDTTVRSGTVQLLHVSEFGKICAWHPEKAREVVTGAFNAITKDGLVVVESTAEGETGYFYDYCQKGRENWESGKELGSLDWKLAFFAWFQDPGNVLSERDVALTVIPPDMVRYFAEIELKMGVTLSPAQRAWYVMKAEEQGEDMKREHPSTPEECFAKTTAGAYYSEAMHAVRSQGRVTVVDVQRGVPVDTAWDLGYSDDTAVWFFQRLPGGRLNIVDFYKNSGEGLEHYLQVLQEKQRTGGWVYGKHIGPHDLAKHDFGTGLSIIKSALKLGLKFEICPNISVQDGISAVRKVLPRCWFDERRTAVDNRSVRGAGGYSGFKALVSYQREWNDRMGRFKDAPKHDWASHTADAFRYLAVWVLANENRGGSVGGAFGLPGVTQGVVRAVDNRGGGYGRV